MGARRSRDISGAREHSAGIQQLEFWLEAVFNTSTNFRLGTSDCRGDGRPDYRYHARVFYGDSISPARAGVSGRTAPKVQGLGFRSNTVASIGITNAPVLAASANQLVVSTPAEADGLQSLALSDPATIYFGNGRRCASKCLYRSEQQSLPEFLRHRSPNRRIAIATGIR